MSKLKKKIVKLNRVNFILRNQSDNIMGKKTHKETGYRLGDGFLNNHSVRVPCTIVHHDLKKKKNPYDHTFYV